MIDSDCEKDQHCLPQSHINKIKKIMANHKIKAIWKSKDFDFPVTVIDFHFLNDEIYCQIKESNACVPLEEIQFLELEEN